MIKKSFYIISYICFAFVFSFAPAAKEQNTRSSIPFDSLLHKIPVKNEVIWDEAYRRKNVAKGKAFLDSLHRFAIQHNDMILALEAELAGYRLELYAEHPNHKLLTEQLYDLSKRAGKLGKHGEQSSSLYWAGEIAYNDLNDYELAMSYYSKMYQSAKSATDQELPIKVYLQLHYANKLYLFKDYKRALPLFKEIISYPVNFESANPIASALNSLGLYYQSIKQWDSSDYYFRRLLDFKETQRHYEWEGIASGNLGKNAFMQSDYDQAIPLLLFSYERMNAMDDVHFAAGICYYLCNIYAYRSNIAATKQWLAKADSLLGSSIPSKYLYFDYAVKSKIYSLEKRSHEANIYLDSALMAYEKYGSEFNSLVLLKMEQTERAQEHQQLEIEQKRGRIQRLYLIGAILALTFISALLLLYFSLYRRKKAAYENLVRRIVEWAYTTYSLPPATRHLLPGKALVLEENIEEYMECEEIQPEDSEDSGFVPENGKALLENIYLLFSTEKLYRNPNLSLQSLSQKLNVSRRTLSESINKIIGVNFKTFVNEYRIKEAVKLLNDPANDKFSLDTIAFETGFNDRITFYRSFKKVTGLSPREFKK